MRSLRIRTICRCDDYGHPVGVHEPDCPFARRQYQQFVDVNAPDRTPTAHDWIDDLKTKEPA